MSSEVHTFNSTLYCCVYLKYNIKLYLPEQYMILRHQFFYSSKNASTLAIKGLNTDVLVHMFAICMTMFHVIKIKPYSNF